MAHRQGEVWESEFLFKKVQRGWVGKKGGGETIHDT